uniref:Uncharacterized protein n=1 Tax=Catharus ustulatus TaxID=91951 RepID=A0A8C3Y057_CATUS
MSWSCLTALLSRTNVLAPSPKYPAIPHHMACLLPSFTRVTSPFFFTSSKVQPFQGFWLFGDDSALNSTIMSPLWEGEEPSLPHPPSVVFPSGRWGSWTEAQLCSSSTLVSFSLNVRLACSNRTGLKGWGLSGGHFSPWSSNCTSGAICGLQMKVEKPQGKRDDTALNDMSVFCCE